VIVVEGVKKRFGKVVALDGVSMRIDRGARVALVGTNGSGKTTLLRAMAGLLSIDGRITIDGVDVAKSPERALRSLAYVPQIAPPLEAPVVEVVRVHATLRGIAPAAVAARAAKLGLDLPAIAKVRFRDLSGGMKQKLLAALALATEAPILVCDEPTANLDPVARAAFFDEIAARRADSVLVVCSHRVDEVRGIVDRVVDMRDGKVFTDESVTALAAGPAPATGPAPAQSRDRQGAVRDREVATHTAPPAAEAAHTPAPIDVNEWALEPCASSRLQ
jgi:ABC-2 type transport system ATP-binding protein